MTSEPRFLIDVIATGTPCPPENLTKGLALLDQLGIPHTGTPDLFHSHPLFIAPDDHRLGLLQQALLNPADTFIWPLRGGYGTARLLPALKAAPQPPSEKPLMGFSDVTALLLFTSQHWGWKPVHGPMLNAFAQSWDKIPFHPDPRKKQMEEAIISLLRAGTAHFEAPLTPLNTKSNTIKAPVTGGNLALCQRSIGTFWQLETQGKIVFFEDINESPHRIGAMLDQLLQTDLLTHAKAVLFGDFTQDTPTAEDDERLDFVLSDFANQVPFPVFKGLPVGHDDINMPIQLNHPATIQNNALTQNLCL